MPIRGPDGVDRAACVLRDVTDQKRAEAALRESEDRYRDLVEHSEDLVCTHDLEGNLLTANLAASRLLGYEIPELLKIPMREFVAPEFRSQFDQYLGRIGTNGADSGLLCVLTKDGRRRIWEYQNSLRTEGVPFPVVRGMAHDVTERKKTEHALRNSELRYRTLFEKSVAGVGIFSWEGLIVDCNGALARMFGYKDVSECRGSRVTRHYRDPAKREELLPELKRTGVFPNREWEYQRIDGSPLWVLLNSVLLTDEDGALMSQSTVFDITDRKRAEDALRHSEENYRNFVPRVRKVSFDRMLTHQSQLIFRRRNSFSASCTIRSWLNATTQSSRCTA